jgi:hypothetical protein
MHKYPITIVDDFYENPNEVRDFALGLKYYSPKELDVSEGIFPGKRTKELGTIDINFFQYSTNKLLNVFHDVRAQNISWKISNKFQIIDKSFQSDWIHSDVGCVFAAIVYLTPNAPLDAGTSIHKKNSNFNHELYEQLNNDKFNFYRGQEEDKREIINSMFTETVRVNNVFNRLLVYEADQFHGGNNFFGTTDFDSRLTQVFFISNIESSSYPLQR